MLRLGETRHGSTTGGNPVAHLRSRSGESRPHGSRYRNADEGRDRPRGGIWSRGSLRGPRCICSKRMRRFHWRGSRLRSGADSCAAGSAPVSNGTFRTPWSSLHNQGSQGPSGTFGYLRVPSETFGYLRVPSEVFGYLRVTSGTFGDLRVPSGTFGDLRVPSSDLRMHSNDLGHLRVPSDVESELLTGYKQYVNNLLITSIIAQNDQKRASKNRTTTTSAQMRKRYCSEKGPQGSLFFPLNPYFSYL